MSTPHELSSSERKRLELLVEINVDSITGYTEAASLTHDEDLTALFDDIAAERRVNAAALGQQLHSGGVSPHFTGSVKAGAHRAWMDLRSFLQKGDRAAVLTEVSRGEHVMRETYERVLEELRGHGLAPLVERQYQGVCAQQERIAGLLEAAGP